MSYKRTLYYEANGTRMAMANRLKRDYEFGSIPAKELIQKYTDDPPSLDIYTIIIEEIIKEYGKENEVN
jgi:hypothetical protein